MDQHLSVVLLVGGLGTRMGAETEAPPKPLVEIGGRPILWHVMKSFASQGHRHFILPLGYRGDLFRRYFVEYQTLTRDFTFGLGNPDHREYHDGARQDPWEVTLLDAGLHTTKSGRVLRAAPHARGDRFFLTYGDGVGNVDLAALLRFHLAHGKLATLTGYKPLSQYGILELDGDRVRGMTEKPRLDRWINAGFRVLERGALEWLSPEAESELESDALPRLAAAGELRMYAHEGFWASMDTFKEAQTLNDLWESPGGAPWKTWKD